MLWSRSLSGFLDGAYSVVQSSDGAFVVAGMTQGSSIDLLFTKIDSLGTTVWNKTVGGPGSDTSIPGSRLIRTSDNGFAYVGSTDSYGSGSNDMYMVKLSSTGVLQFAKPSEPTEANMGTELFKLQIMDMLFAETFCLWEPTLLTAILLT
ncbi:MAG: hypothetical protein IPK10_11420 [Bacteroidetes bacterium]|nr:hypothetical protein [Bacteroidota bacterium]